MDLILNFDLLLALELCCDFGVWLYLPLLKKKELSMLTIKELYDFNQKKTPTAKAASN